MSESRVPSAESEIPVKRQHGAVVFTDIVGYSKRPTVNQQKLVTIFTSVVRAALHEAGVDLGPQAIAVPTGDGFAVCLPESPEVDTSLVALHFVKALAHHVNVHNLGQSDSFFSQYAWSPKTTAFYLRIGVARGELLTFTDINGQPNFAGRIPNEAARLMSVADPNQALFSSEFRRHLGEFHPQEATSFHELPDITIKDQRYRACQLRFNLLDGEIPSQFASPSNDVFGYGQGVYPVPWIPFDHSDPDVRFVAVTGTDYEAVRSLCLTAFPEHCGELLDITAAERGSGSRNYCVTTPDKKLLIKWHKRMSDRDKIVSLYEIQRQIADSGIFGDYGDALLPFKTKTGDAFVKRGSEYVSAFPFVEDVTYYDGSGLDAIEEVGRAYGKVNRVLADYRPTNGCWPMPRSLSIDLKLFDAVSRTYQPHRHKDEMVAAFYFLEKEGDLIRKALEEVAGEVPRSQPSLVELHPHNIFFKSGKCVLIFDYEAVTDQWPEDAACAYAIHRFCREYVRERQGKDEAVKVCVKRFLKGYEEGRGHALAGIREKLPWWIKRTNLPKLIRALSYVTGAERDTSNRPPSVLVLEAAKFIACLKEADSFGTS